MSDAQVEADGPSRMTAVKWILLAAWIVTSYFLSFLSIIILDDRKMISASWGSFLEIVYTPLLWLYWKSPAFEASTDGIVDLFPVR